MKQLETADKESAARRKPQNPVAGRFQGVRGQKAPRSVKTLLHAGRQAILEGLDVLEYRLERPSVLGRHS